MDRLNVIKQNRVRAAYLSAHEREAQIVSLAMKCFCEKGFSVSTRILADYIGITQPLLFRYFSSKNELISRVFDDFFFNKWNPLWESKILDRKIDIKQRLFDYMQDYTRVILNDQWIRLFLFSALEDPALNKKYISLLQERIFIPAIQEIRHHKQLPPISTPLEIELFWGVHSSFFYMGVRRWVYDLDIPVNIDEIIRHRVKMLISSIPATED